MNSDQFRLGAEINPFKVKREEAVSGVEIW